MLDDPDAAYVHDTAPIRPPSRRGRRALLALAAIATVVAAVVAVRASPLTQPAKPPPSVAYVDPAGSIAVLEVASGRRTTYPSAGSTFQFPAWSPDGSRIAAIGTSSTGTSVSVFTVSEAAPGPATVAYLSKDAPPFYLYWSPDGHSITFLTSEGSDLSLREVSPEATGPADVVWTGSPMYWAWESPARLLIHSGADTPAAFFGEVARDGSNAHGSLIDPGSGGPGNFRAPAVSADGRYVGYAETKTDGTAAVVTSLLDGSSRHETKVLGPAAVSFAPAGDQLAFIAATTFQQVQPIPLGPVRIMDATTGATSTVVSGEAVASFWSPDGKTLAVLLVPPPTGPSVGIPGASLASVRGPGSGLASATPAAADPGFELQLAFVDVATGTTRSTTTVHVTGAFVDQVLPFFDQYALSHRTWASDGSSLVLPLAGDGGVETIWLVPADGSTPRLLIPGSAGAWSP